jgi:hypothetical protein
LEASAACVVKLSGTQASFFMSIHRKISRRHRPDTYALPFKLWFGMLPMPLSLVDTPAGGAYCLG